MAMDQTRATQHPLRIGWAVGLLTLAAVVFVSAFLPALLVLLLGGSAGAGGMAIFGGVMAGWFAYIGVIRLGLHRGWWA